MSGFSEELQRYLGELADLRQRGASEDSIRDAFLRFLRAAFPNLGQAEPILLEKHVPAVRVRGGFADALYGDLIFECKRRLDDASRATGQEELTRYLRNQRHPERFLGILTDGETLEVYALREDKLAPVDQLVLAADHADEVRLWLDCYLFHEKHLVPTAADVALRFGERSPTFWHSIRVLQELWGQVGASATAQTKCAEWQSLLAIVYGSAVGDEALFLRHTYLALFARVLAFVALQRRAPGTTELPGIVAGEVFEQMGLENFVENDFFAWVNDPAIFAAARGLLHALATRLAAAYDLDAIHEDLLKELYQELVDPQTRHDLGEFYTPDWLAELTLREAGYPPKEGDASLLDPSCGSGTFLFVAVRLLREAGRTGKALAEFCADHLAGIDVHPLAVTIAKTNVLLALGRDLPGGRRRLALPVYMADTLSSPEPDFSEKVVRVAVDVAGLAERASKRKPRNLPSRFGLPEELAGRAEHLDGALDALLQFADPRIGDEEAQHGLDDRLREIGLINGNGRWWLDNLRLMRWLLQEPATDTVWRFILRNAYQPELLARRKFAFVAGNPPWLSYRYIRRPDYQERVRNLVFKYELQARRQAHLVTQMELATLFAAFCADRFLSEKGTLAFVMPRSILTGAKQHTAFREHYVATCRSLIDCEQVGPLFNVPACVLITSSPGVRSQQPSKRISLLRLQGEVPSRNASLAEAEKHWRANRTKYQAAQAVISQSPYLQEVIQGATIVPHCLWFVRVPEIALHVNARRPPLVTDISTERQAKAPWKGVRLQGSVEGDFLYATLLCDQLLPFGWRQMYLTVLPLAGAKGSEPFLIDEQEAFRQGKAFLGNWLRQADQHWKKNRKSDASLIEYLNWQGKLTRQHPTGVLKVLLNDAGTHICSCVVDAREVDSWWVHGLPVRGFVAEHVTYWLETENAEEAHYLCAVLNAPLVDKAIKPYQTRGAFGAKTGKGERHVGRRPFEVLPIPRFNRKEKQYRELARLSMTCHEKLEQLRLEADEQWFTTPIGRLRTQLRVESFQEELAAIDALAAAILGIAR